MGKKIKGLLNLNSLLGSVAAFVVMAFSHSIFAASEVVYHGRILKSDDTPISGSVDFTLEVRSTGSENCLLYSETQTKTVIDGVFSLSLGTGVRTDSTGYSFENVFSNRQMFSLPTQCTAPAISWTPAATSGRKLVVNFQDSTMVAPETLPTQALNMVPQAIDAQMVGGYGSGELLKVNNSGSVALTQTNLEAMFTGTAYTNLQAVMSGTFPTTTLVTGSGSAAAPSLSFSGNTNTGFYNSSTDTIGVSSSGINIFNINSSGIVSPTTGGAAVATAIGDASYPTYGFAGDAGLGWYRSSASTLAAATGGVERMRISASGYVGIGTTTPAFLLHVDGNIANTYTSTSGVLQVPSGVTARFQNSYSGDGSFGGFEMRVLRGDGVTQRAFMGAVSNTAGRSPDIIIGHQTGGAAYAERMRFMAGGNVGIGTSAPTAKLEIAGGEFRISGATSGYVGLKAPAVAGSGVLTLPATVGTSGQTLITDGSGVLSWANGGASGVFPIALGSAATPSMNFSGDTNTGFYSPGVDQVAISTSGVERFRISESGNVSIGTQLITDRLFVQVLSDGASGGTSTGRGISLRDGVDGGTWDTVNPNVAFKFISNDTSGVGSGVRVSLGTVMESATGGSSRFGIFTAPAAAGTLVERLTVKSDGSVGIGTTNPSYTLDVAGDARATGSVTSWSDIRVKKNIQPIDNSLEKILNLEGVTFDWKTEEFADKKFKKGRDIGVIAQNVEVQFPEIVETGKDGYKSVAYQKLVAPLIEAVKTLYHRFVDVERDVASLQESDAQRDKQIQRLEEENAKLKAYLCAKDPNAPICK